MTEAPRPPLVTAMGWLCLALPALLYVFTIADAAIATTGLLFLIFSWRSRDFTWMRQPWVILGAIFWAYATLRGLLSESPANSAPVALVWIRFVVFAAAMQAVARRWPRFTELMGWSLLAFSLLGAADAIFQFFVGHDVFGRPEIYGRLTGPLSRPAIGLLLLLTGLPAIALMMRELADRTCATPRKLAALGVILTIAAAIFLSGERMTLVLLAVALVACTALIARPSRKMWGGMTVIAIGILACVYALFPSVWLRHASLLTIFQNPSDAFYLTIWRTALRMFTDHPVVGVGLHNFRTACALYADTAQQVCSALHPHQFWLEWLAETGVVGTGLMVAFFVAVFRTPIVLWPTWREQPLLAGACIAVLVRLWPLATTHSFFVSQNEVVFWTMVAVAVASCARADRPSSGL